MEMSLSPIRAKVSIQRSLSFLKQQPRTNAALWAVKALSTDLNEEHATKQCHKSLAIETTELWVQSRRNCSSSTC